MSSPMLAERCRREAATATLDMLIVDQAEKVPTAN